MKRKWRVTDGGFWIVLTICAVDFVRLELNENLLFQSSPLSHDLTWLMIWSVLVKLNELEDLITQKRKPYIAPKLRPLEWTELTPEQQAWFRDQKTPSVGTRV
jgi:hypothetical protein